MANPPLFVGDFFGKICDIFCRLGYYCMKGVEYMHQKDKCDEIFRQSYELYAQQILKYCMVRLGDSSDTADDCVQNAFLVYYKKLLAGEEIAQPKAFLYRAAENFVKKSLREKKQRQKKILPLDSVREVSAPEVSEKAARLDYDEIKRILLTNLSDSEQLLYYQKYEQNLSLKEIAEYYSILPTAAANRISRLRKKIIALTQPVLSDFEKGGY